MKDDPNNPSACEWPLSRRDFVKGATAVVGATTIAPTLVHAVSEAAPPRETKQVPLTLTVNGKAEQMMIDPRTSLLDLLREDLKLTGTKKGCDHGQCGACTVLANGRRINSCLSLALVHEGEKIITIEGLAHGEELHPLQAAF